MVDILEYETDDSPMEIKRKIAHLRTDPYLKGLTYKIGKSRSDLSNDLAHDVIWRNVIIELGMMRLWQGNTISPKSISSDMANDIGNSLGWRLVNYQRLKSLASEVKL